MTSMAPEFDVHDMVRELTEPHTRREPYTVEEDRTTWELAHVVRALALADQLLTDPPSSGGQVGSVPHSKPTLSIERHDLLAEIDEVADDWLIRFFHVDSPAAVLDERWMTVPGSRTKARLRRLHGLLPSVRRCTGYRPIWTAETDTWCCPWHHLEFILSGWWHRARVLLGWEPASVWRQHNTCPACGRKGLIVNVAASRGSCSHCPALFVGDSWSSLLLSIRVENDLIKEGAE